MIDLENLFEAALADGHGPDPAQRIDPTADLARGRRLLRRRRLTRAAGVAGLATVVAAAGVVPSHLGTRSVDVTAVSTSGGTRPGQTNPGQTNPGQTRLPPIALVAYSGAQPPGYTVAEVPRDWVVQGGDAFALVLAPQDAADHDIHSFVGKLVVMLLSKDAEPPTTGTAQQVDGRPGFVHVEGDTQVLIFERADGRWVVIQAPTSLGWDGARLAQFAAGVQVLGNADPGVG